MIDPTRESPRRHEDETVRPAHRLACPRCGAKYGPAAPTAGRRVRCYHCGHVWRDEHRALAEVVGSLSRAADAWLDVGSTTLAHADHASTMGRLVDEAAAPRPPASDWVGRTIGKYELKAVLGQGAMGYVYEAFDADLRRTVALKMLPRHEPEGSRSVGRRMFVQEARVAARLQHPNIVTIYDVGEDDGIQYFAMEQVHGTTLTVLVRTHGPLPAKQACFVIAHAARALAAGHREGVVHRDVKPGNIMIDATGAVKVTDFGLADVTGLEGIDAVEDLSTRALGTPGWISPEVAREERATPASDIYGLGLTLYFVLTGERLIRAKSKSAMIRKQQVAASVRREDLPPGWPPRLRDIVLQCLHADPADRYQSADSLAADLLRALSPAEEDGTIVLGAEDNRSAAGRTTPLTVVWSVLLLACVGAVLAAWWYFAND